jgi:prepilin-type processing-associated H-X9-DG protein
VWARVDDWDGDGILDTRTGTAAIYGGGAPFRHHGTSNILWADGHVASTRAREWLARTGFDPAFGARPLRRLVQREIGDQLARELLSGQVRDGDTVLVDVDETDADAGLLVRAARSVVP